jgi:hypothetical protein
VYKFREIRRQQPLKCDRVLLQSLWLELLYS